MFPLRAPPIPAQAPPGFDDAMAATKALARLGPDQPVGIVELPEQEARDRLWRRETNRVGQGGHYVHRRNPGLDTLIIEHHENLGGVAIVLAARFVANIAPLNAEILAALAIESAQKLDDGRDGISYLLNTKRNGIATPLSAPYEREILRRMQATTLEDALKKIRACARSRCAAAESR